MKKISLVFIAFFYLFLSCSKEQNLVVEPFSSKTKEQVMELIKGRYEKFGRPKVDRLSQQQLKDNILNDKVFLDLLAKNNISPMSVYEKQLANRTVCQELTYCWIYEYGIY